MQMILPVYDLLHQFANYLRRQALVYDAEVKTFASAKPLV